MSRRREHGREAGFTLIELMVGTVLSVIVMLALYGFMDNSFQAFSSRQNAALALSQARTAINQLSSQLRQAVSPDGGITPPIAVLTPTEVEFYADMSRSATELVPKPQEFLYQVSNGQLIRQIAQPIGASPPYSYGGFSSAETLVPSVSNSASAPLFSAVNDAGTAMPASLGAPATVGIAQVHINLLAGYVAGIAITTFTLGTDVVPENPTAASN